MVLKYEERENNSNTLRNDKLPRNINQIIKEELERLAKGEVSSAQNYLRFYYNALRRHDILNTSKTREETLHDAINLLKKDHPEFTPEVNWDFFDASKYEDNNDDRLLDEVRLKAEIIRKKKQRKTTLLSVMRASSTLMLFLSLGLLQYNFPLYLFTLMVGCIILGLSTFMERGT